MPTVATLLPQIYSRVEEPPDAPVFWTGNEANFAAIEALNDLMLLVGRPTQIVSVPFTIEPNTPWQTLPIGVFAISDIQGSASQVYKVTLEDFDYLQVYNGSDWTQDVGETIQQWCPIGMTMFAVHPCVSDYQTVLITGIQYPCMQTWPYTASTIDLPFADQYLATLEKYAAHYLRFKEGGDDFSESYKLYQSYLKDAQRMTQLQDRRDPVLFTMGVGVQTISNPTTSR